jgi:hypothetical protein
VNASVARPARVGVTAPLRLGGSDRQLAAWRTLPFATKDSSEVSRPRHPDVAFPIVRCSDVPRIEAITGAGASS